MFHFFFLIWVILYFLPSIIGWQKRNAAAIVVVNLLFGWTVIGWIVALVWALTEGPANWGPFSAWQPAGPGPQAPPQQPPYQPYQAPPVSPNVSQQTRAGFCSHCGSPLRAGDRFCAGCGSGVPQA